MPPSFSKRRTDVLSALRGSLAAETEKEQTSLLTAKIAGKLPVAAQLVADKSQKAYVLQ
jgi:hypothetical protein